MTTEPLVCIILVNWNGKDDTLECLASLRRQTYVPHRILVVDNASRDGSAQAIRSLYPEAELLELPENRRFAGGNNAGIRRALEAGAEYVLLLNNDTTADGDMVRNLVRAIRSQPGAGIVAPKISYHDTPGLLWYAGGVISFWTGTMRHVGIREEDRGQHDTPGETGYASGCCLLVSREVIERIGLLDESYFMYAEDADWSIRARRAGYRILYEPAARVWHKVSVSAGGHLSSFKLRHKFLSNLRFFSRHARWYHWLTFPWLTIPVNALAALAYLLRRRAT
jgi:hypothetical protein